MFRKDLIEILRGHPVSLSDLAKQLVMEPRDLEQDVEHLAKTLKRTEFLLDVTPAECRKCGFKFRPDKLHKPSKCPLCRSSWLSEPLIQVVNRER